MSEKERSHRPCRRKTESCARCDRSSSGHAPVAVRRLRLSMIVIINTLLCANVMKRSMNEPASTWLGTGIAQWRSRSPSPDMSQERTGRSNHSRDTHRLHALLPGYPYAHVSKLDHADIVGSVSNRQRHDLISQNMQHSQEWCVKTGRAKDGETRREAAHKSRNERPSCFP